MEKAKNILIKGTGWKEEYLEGSQEAEEKIFDDLAQRIKNIQKKVREKARRKEPNASTKRGFHAKGTGVRGKFHIIPDLSPDMRVGLFQPNAGYEALVRFSNARSEIKPDKEKDQRGIGIRVKMVEGEKFMPEDQENIQDFLMTNTPVTPTSDPRVFIELGELFLGSQLTLPLKLILKYGVREGSRIFKELLEPKEFLININSWQASSFFSRAPIKFGDYAVKFMVKPSEEIGVNLVNVKGLKDPDFLRNSLKEHLRVNDIVFDFCIQFFVDNDRTPIENSAQEWKETVAPFETVAKLIIPQQELEENLEKEIENMAFTPWNTRDLRPLGRMNRVRKKVYDSSARERGSPFVA